MTNATDRELDVDRRAAAGLPQGSAEIEALRRCWRSLGVRRLALEWELSRPTRLRPGLAGELRSALGPALRLMGAGEAFRAVHGARGVPAFWFLGWDCPPGPVTLVQAEAVCLGALAGTWPELAAALGRLRLTAVGGGLASCRRLRLRWLPGDTEERGFGPPVPEPTLELPPGACLVEATGPLCVRSQGRVHREPPPPEVLVRSAGERLRQLAERWGEVGEVGELPAVVGRAVQEAGRAWISWARTRVERASRRSSRTGQVQELVGLRGVVAYEGVSSLAMALLTLGAELGVGKDIAFGCGGVRLFRATAG